MFHTAFVVEFLMFVQNFYTTIVCLQIEEHFALFFAGTTIIHHVLMA